MSTPLVVPLREGMHYLTWDQRKVWGVCPCCLARHGEECRVDDGKRLGFSVTGVLPPSGVHEERLEVAPQRVRVEALS